MTQQVVDIIRQQLNLPSKLLPTRRVVVPEQLEGSNACGYYAACSYGWFVHNVLQTNSTASYTYSECVAVEALVRADMADLDAGVPPLSDRCGGDAWSHDSKLYIPPEGLS